MLVQDNPSCCMLDSLKASYVLERSAIQNGVQLIQAWRNKCWCYAIGPRSASDCQTGNRSSAPNLQHHRHQMNPTTQYTIRIQHGTGVRWARVKRVARWKLESVIEFSLQVSCKLYESVEDRSFPPYSRLPDTSLPPRAESGVKEPLFLNACLRSFSVQDKIDKAFSYRRLTSRRSKFIHTGCGAVHICIDVQNAEVISSTVSARQDRDVYVRAGHGSGWPVGRVGLGHEIYII